MTAPKILAFAGSTRTESFNKKLVKIAADAARSAGAEVTLIDLRDLELPLFDQDFEEEHGHPPGSLRLKELMNEHDGLLISSPEYNSSISGVLKNAIDWASRKATSDEPALHSFTGKVAAIMSASPGGLGGLRGLVHLRSILVEHQRISAARDQKAISAAHTAFDEDGSLKDPKQQQAIAGIAEKLTDVLKKLGS